MDRIWISTFIIIFLEATKLRITRVFVVFIWFIASQTASAFVVPKSNERKIVPSDESFFLDLGIKFNVEILEESMAFSFRLGHSYKVGSEYVITLIILNETKETSRYFVEYKPSLIGPKFESASYIINSEDTLVFILSSNMNSGESYKISFKNTLPEK